MKRIALSIAIILLTSNIFSAEISEQQAITAGKNFFFERIYPGTKIEYKDLVIENITTRKNNGKTIYYTISFINNGFVIVSGCDAIIPVLGFSLTSKFHELDQPPAFIRWMQDYETQILWAIENNYTPPAEINQEWQRLLKSTPEQLKHFKSTKSVAPLLKTTWNQGKYYNHYCPTAPGGPDGRAYAGCVPTAMGQIMNYYRHPQQGIGSYSYVHPDYGTLSADFGNTIYEWDKMPLAVTERQNDSAVAKLLYHLGVSVDLDYGPNGSGMYNHKAAYALRTYFKYSPDCEYIFRDTATHTNWKQLILTHLDQKKPLYYAGWADTLNISGHAFVCDGYQDTNYFHFNWGWGGALDGYFIIDNLTPGGNNFTLDHELILNFYPDTTTGYPYPCNGNVTLTQTKGTFGDGSGPLYNYRNSSDCFWLIQPMDSVHGIKLKFLEFNTETDSDLVIIYEGSSTCGGIIGIYSGNNIPPQITTESKSMLVHFVSNDTINSSGFLAYYESIVPVFCSSAIQEFTSPSGSFEDGSGTFHYHPNQLCRWRIKPTGASSIFLHFNSFDLAPLDYVRIIDLEHSVDIDTFYGNDVPYDIVCNSGSMMIIFKTFEEGTGQGFSVYYSTYTNIPENLITDNSLTVMPNPAKEKLILQFENKLPDTPALLEIFSINGKQIFTKKIETFSGNHTYEVDISNLNSGLYILKFTDNQETFVKKIIIE